MRVVITVGTTVATALLQYYYRYRRHGNRYPYRCRRRVLYYYRYRFNSASLRCTELAGV